MSAMAYFSIRGRLIFIAVVLLAILTVSSTILTRELMRDLQSLADEAQLVQVVQNANEASKHFGDLKYWLTDYARTLLAASQRQADAAKAQLEIELKAVAPVDAADVAAIRARGRRHDGARAKGVRRLFERRQRRPATSSWRRRRRTS